MTLSSSKSFDLPNMRAIAFATLVETDEQERDLARRCVGRLADQWARKNGRTRQRRRFNELLVRSVLGVADEQEEDEVLWRMWLRPQRGHFSEG